MAPFTDRIYHWVEGQCAYGISEECHQAKKREFVCKTCWVNNSDEADQPKWTDWFLRREQAYPGVFPDDKDI